MSDVGNGRYLELMGMRCNPYRSCRLRSGPNTDAMDMTRFSNYRYYNERLGTIDSEFNNHDSGRGVVANRTIVEHEYICGYFGRWVRGEVPGKYNVYISELGMTKVGAPRRCAGCIINDSRDTNWNCALALNRNGELYVFATREIAA